MPLLEHPVLEQCRNQDQSDPAPQPAGVGLPPAFRDELLDPAIWEQGLEKYAVAMTLAVALTDANGRLLGKCVNPQPTWSLLRRKQPAGVGACPFSLAALQPCTCVADALAKGGLVQVRDRTGLVHFAVPLRLGEQPLGALLAGQVFDHYPDQRLLEQAAKKLGLPPHKVWEAARQEHPISHANLQVYADLLVTLGYSFLQSRYHTITEAGRLAEMTRLRDLAVAEMAERQRAEHAILASLQDKEVLLQEIHHRVKNNLQVISSLLRLQSRSIQDAPTLTVLRESQQRVQSMALIHEKLYQSQDVSRVRFAAYVRSLAAELFGVYQVQADAIRLRTGVDDLLLTVDQAIPCGLILNELLSNCLKHAFPSGRKGEIRIEFRLETPSGYLLTVADDGVGVPNQVEFRTTSSLGLRLVRALTNQLRGTIDCHCDGGAKFELRFPQSPHPEALMRPEALMDPSTTPDESAEN